MKNHPAWTELLHPNLQTDIHEEANTVVAFLDFAKASKSIIEHWFMSILLDVQYTKYITDHNNYFLSLHNSTAQTILLVGSCIVTAVLSCGKRGIGVVFPTFWSEYSGIPLTRDLVNRIATYQDRHAPSGEFTENPAKLTCLEIASYPIKYRKVTWLLELQIRRGRKV